MKTYYADFFTRSMHNRRKFTIKCMPCSICMYEIIYCYLNAFCAVAVLRKLVKAKQKVVVSLIMGASFAFCFAPSVMGTLICTHANYLCRIAISQVISTMQLWLVS